MFSKSANPARFTIRQISTIRALFKAKSVDPKTYSSPLDYALMSDGYIFQIFILICTYMLPSGKIVSYCYYYCFSKVILVFDISRSAGRGWWIAQQQNQNKVLLNCRHYFQRQMVDPRSIMIMYTASQSHEPEESHQAA